MRFKISFPQRAVAGVQAVENCIHYTKCFTAFLSLKSTMIIERRSTKITATKICMLLLTYPW
jgi:hypothetical protein